MVISRLDYQRDRPKSLKEFARVIPIEEQRSHELVRPALPAAFPAADRRRPGRAVDHDPSKSLGR
jgi:hypothetical protein